MKMMIKTTTRSLFFVLLALVSCNPMGGDGVKVVFKDANVANGKLTSSVSGITVINNQLVLTGTAMSNVQTVTLTNNTQTQTFQVESATETQLIANATSAITILANNAFDLILSNSYGSATFPVTFSVSDGAITGEKINSMGATAGQFLKYDGTTWAPASIASSQTYLGNWNASTNNPSISTLSSFHNGDYYIVTTGGTYSSITFVAGDWVMFDGTAWHKIDNTSNVVRSFNTRSGAVTLQPSDYVSLKDGTTHKVTGSSINDLADIDLTTLAPVNGSVLKFNGTKWVAGVDEDNGIAAGSIMDADISNSAAIAQSKINGLTSDLAAKQNSSSLAADVRAIALTGLASSSGAISATDTILGAFGKLMNTQSDYVSKSSGASILTGTIAVSGTGMITIPTATGVTATEAANVTYVNNAIAANGVWAKNGSDINYSGGNIGVGTTTPQYGLEIAGSGLVPALFAVRNTTSNTTVEFRSQSNGFSGVKGNGQFQIGSDNAVYIGVPYDAERMRITSAGNVGIGTTTPKNTLEVAGTTKVGSGPSSTTTVSVAALAADTSITVLDTTNYPSSGILVTGYSEIIYYTGKTATTFTGLTRGRMNSTASSMAVGASIDLCVFCATASDTATPKIVATSTHGVGIGGAPPSWSTNTSLYVAGNLYVGNVIQAITGLTFGTSSANITANGSSTTSDYMKFYTNSVERLRLDGSGGISMGTIAPITNATLSVGGAMVSTLTDLATGGAVDLSKGNTFTLNAVGGSTITLSNPAHGGSYTLVIVDTTSRTYTFSGCTNSYFKPANAATTVGTQSIYTILTVKSGANWNCYITWAAGYQ